MENKYNYYEAVKADVKEYIQNEVDLTEYETAEEAETALHDELWISDSVTGNGSGSYTFSTWKAEENLCHNFELIEEVASEFGIEPIIKSGWEYGAEWWDVTIRCYYLASAIAEVIEEAEYFE